MSEDGTHGLGRISGVGSQNSAQPGFILAFNPSCCSLHPYDPGHQTLAELLVQPLVRAVQEVEAGEALGEDDVRHAAELTAADLPPPMIPGNADEEPGFCALLESAWVPGSAVGVCMLGGCSRRSSPRQLPPCLLQNCLPASLSPACLHVQYSPAAPLRRHRLLNAAPPPSLAGRRTSRVWLSSSRALSTDRSGPTPAGSGTRSGGGRPASRVRGAAPSWAGKERGEASACSGRWG